MPTFRLYKNRLIIQPSFPSIHVCIISWTGKHANAVRIAQLIGGKANRISIIYSDKDENLSLNTPFQTIRTNNNLFWGGKFRHAIDNFSEEILLFIHADCTSQNWPTLILSCQRAFAAHQDLGMWAPLTQGTACPLAFTSLFEADKGKMDVAVYIDGIVFAMNKRVVIRMRELDYTSNVYGWGIDWAAAAYTYSHGMFAAIDKTVEVFHTPGRGYPDELALKQMPDFMSQLTKREKIHYFLIRSHIRYQRLMALKNNSRTDVSKLP